MLKIVDDAFKPPLDPDEPRHAGKHLLEMLDKAGIPEIDIGEFIVIFNTQDNAYLFSNEGDLGDIKLTLAKTDHMLLLQSMGADLGVDSIE